MNNGVGQDGSLGWSHPAQMKDGHNADGCTSTGILELEEGQAARDLIKAVVKATIQARRSWL